MRKECGGSDTKHGGRDRLMWGRTRFERMMKSLEEDVLEMAAHGWKRSRSVVSQEMMVHEQRRRLGAGLDPQSFERVAQLPSRLLNGS